MNSEYLIKAYGKFKEDQLMKQTVQLKEIILGPGDFGFLSTISGLLDNKFSKFYGRNQRVVSRSELVEALVQADFTTSYNRARESILPRFEDISLRYKSSSKKNYHLLISKIENKTKKREGYLVSRGIE